MSYLITPIITNPPTTRKFISEVFVTVFSTIDDVNIFLTSLRSPCRDLKMLIGLDLPKVNMLVIIVKQQITYPQIPTMFFNSKTIYLNEIYVPEYMGYEQDVGSMDISMARSIKVSK